MLLAVASPSRAAADWEGLPVKEIRHQPEEPEQQPMDAAALQEMLPQKTGAR